MFNFYEKTALLFLNFILIVFIERLVRNRFCRGVCSLYGTAFVCLFLNFSKFGLSKAKFFGDGITDDLILMGYFIVIPVFCIFNGILLWENNPFNIKQKANPKSWEDQEQQKINLRKDLLMFLTVAVIFFLPVFAGIFSFSHDPDSGRYSSKITNKLRINPGPFISRPPSKK